MTDPLFETFIRENERKQNEIMIKVLSFAVLIGPIMLIGNLLHIFPGSGFGILILLTIYIVTTIVTIKLMCYFSPYSSLTKYIILSLIEILIFFISINDFFCLFISYGLVALISCFYYKMKLSIKYLIGNYFIMILSIIIRAKYVAPNYPGIDSGFNWGINYSFGLTTEYIILSIFISALNKKYNSIMLANLEAVTTLQKAQETLTTSYTALVSQKQEGIRKHFERSTAFVKIICAKFKQDLIPIHSLEDTKLSLHSEHDYLQNLCSAAPLHDIGIVAIPNEILDRLPRMLPADMDIYKKHTFYGEKIIRENLYTIENRDFLKIARDIALYHHERWDGRGYPEGLVGEKIPLSARIVAAANLLDKLLSSENGAEPMTIDNALIEVKKEAGLSIDPVIADIIIQCKSEIVSSLSQLVKIG